LIDPSQLFLKHWALPNRSTRVFPFGPPFLVYIHESSTLAKAYEIKSVVSLGTTLEHIGSLKENPLELDANTFGNEPHIHEYGSFKKKTTKNYEHIHELINMNHTKDHVSYQ